MGEQDPCAEVVGDAVVLEAQCGGLGGRDEPHDGAIELTVPLPAHSRAPAAAQHQVLATAVGIGAAKLTRPNHSPR